jgi:hypothetical protein
MTSHFSGEVALTGFFGADANIYSRLPGNLNRPCLLTRLVILTLEKECPERPQPKIKGWAEEAEKRVLKGRSNKTVAAQRSVHRVQRAGREFLGIRRRTDGHSRIRMPKLRLRQEKLDSSWRFSRCPSALRPPTALGRNQSKYELSELGVIETGSTRNVQPTAAKLASGGLGTSTRG